MSCFLERFGLFDQQRPFRAKTNAALTEAILMSEPIYPVNVNEIVTPECLDFLKRLMTRDINDRIGTFENGGQQVFRSHPWFNSINWRQLEAKRCQPPFVPDASFSLIQSKNSNFDATHELVELFIEDKPLRSKSTPRKKSKSERNLSVSSHGGAPVEMSVADKQREAMEEKYLVYDFTKPLGYRSFHRFLLLIQWSHASCLYCHRSQRNKVFHQFALSRFSSSFFFQTAYSINFCRYHGGSRRGSRIEWFRLCHHKV